MDERDRLAGVLRQLRELGLSEIFLDELTADAALDLAAGTSDRSRTADVPGTPDPRTAPVTGRTSPPGPSDGPDPETPSEQGSAAARLEVLAQDAAGCTRCRLSEDRTQVVYGRGSAGADLVVVGEAPGREEDRTGLPFVGPAGKLLDLLLLSVGIERGSAYICNVLKCRPPRNRDPQADEVATCAPYLHAQLDVIQPRVLLGVGKFAAQWLSGKDQSIGRLRGTVHEYRGVPVVATYHPAYLLRSPQATRKTWQDLQLMRQVLDEHA